MATESDWVCRFHPRLGESASERSDLDHERNIVRAQRTIRCARRIDGAAAQAGLAVVVGCGPRPSPVKVLQEEGYTALGVEPAPAFVQEARDYLGSPDLVLEGTAEELPVEDESAALILLDNVLEHVDSVGLTLAEAHRALSPGGVLFVKTSNRLELTNREYTVPCYQWMPALLRESIIHQHLHFDPALANFTSRPAVHWFTYASLCSAGREAGFAWFYSVTDLLHSGDPEIAGSRLRRLALTKVQRSSVVRTLALTQAPGSTVFMVKRR